MIVLGGGVSGLTTATVLAEAGHAVEVWAAALPPHTTSNVAAAFWYPYRAFPFDRVLGWAKVAYAQFVTLCDDPRAGVRMRRAFDYARAPQARPWWADAVRGLAELPEAECPPGFAFGWGFDAPVIDTRVYLPYLRARLEAAGGRVIERRVTSFGEAAGRDVVINCCGLGARELCNDGSLHPVRGQLVHVDNPGVDRVLLDEHDGGGIAYVVPRGDHVVLGGTAAEHDEALDVRPAEADAIVARCAQLDPRLADAARRTDVVGLRPGRATIRLEGEAHGDLWVVHNYGHGGAGVTLSWGCAAEVLEHVARRSAA